MSFLRTKHNPRPLTDREGAGAFTCRDLTGYLFCPGMSVRSKR